jgi:hypothetical protein
MNIELLGYIGTTVVMASFMMSNVKWLRIVNSIGCSIWILYGFQIESMPVVLTNVGILAINLFHIIKNR